MFRTIFMNQFKYIRHCHFFGSFRGAARDYCNLNYLDYFMMPVDFHNLNWYDCHFIIKALAKEIPDDVQLLQVTKKIYKTLITKI